MKTLNFKTLYNFKGYVVDELICEESAVQVKLKFDLRIPPRCPHCSGKVPRNKCGMSCAMDNPVAGVNKVFVTFPTVQGRCSNCDRFVTTRPKEIHESKAATWRFMRLISSWATIAPANQVGKMFEISGSTVRNYDLCVLKEELPEPNFDGIRALLVDEKSVRKNGNFVTVVLNADTGELLHMEEGKKSTSLNSFFDKLTDVQKSSIQAVGIDRGGAYKKSIKLNLPKANIVYDRFHLMMNINKAVDEVRRIEWHSADKSQKTYIKSSRYLLLANGYNLDEKGSLKLAILVEANQSISKAYLMKEQFRCIYEYKSAGWAKKALMNWCEMAKESKLKPFVTLAKGFVKDALNIVSYAKHRITSGRIEGFNNLISRIIHRSCGVTNLTYLFYRLRHASLMLCV